MRKNLLILFSVLCVNIYAQENDTLNRQQELVVGKNCKISLDGKQLTTAEVKNILSAYPDLQKMYSNGVLNKSNSVFFGCIGGIVFGAGIGGILGNVIAGTEIQYYNFYIIGAGVVLCIPAIALDTTGKNKIKNAIRDYNDKQVSKNYSAKMNFVLTSNGAGITIDF